MFDALVDSIVSTKVLVIGRQDDLVFSSPISSDSVIGEGFGRVEVEHEEQVSSFEYANFVALHRSECSFQVESETKPGREGELTSFLSET